MKTLEVNLDSESGENLMFRRILLTEPMKEEHCKEPTWLLIHLHLKYVYNSTTQRNRGK